MNEILNILLVEDEPIWVNFIEGLLPKDKYAKHIFFKASMVGPGEIELGEASFKQVYTKTKPGETIKQ